MEGGLIKEGVLIVKRRQCINTEIKIKVANQDRDEAHDSGGLHAQ